MLLFAVSVGLIALVIVGWGRLAHGHAARPNPRVTTAPVARIPVVKQDTPKSNVPPVQPDPSAKVQAALDKWVSTQGHQQYWGVLVRGTGSADWRASVNADEAFATDSLYKLPVAYLAYQKVDDGTYSLQQPYVNGWTRQRCLDEMIRNSDSPCAEAWMAELGMPAIQKMVDDYGLRHTSIASLTTTASDIAELLARLQAGRDLSQASTKLLKASMLGQKWRHGLPKGFAPWPVYDKSALMVTPNIMMLAS